MTPTADPTAGAGGEELAGTVTWGEVAAQAAEDLRRGGLEGAALDVRRIVEEVTGAEGAEYHDVLGERATVRRLARFDALRGPPAWPASRCSTCWAAGASGRSTCWSTAGC